MKAEKSAPITVAIVDDHEAIRLGFEASCKKFGCKLVGSAATVNELLEKLTSPPQVVVLDLSLADSSSPAENVRKVIEFGSKVLIFSIADRKQQVRA